MKLIEYDVIIEHRPGKLNTNVNALSRILNEELIEINIVELGVERENIEPVTGIIWDEETTMKHQHQIANLEKSLIASIILIPKIILIIF